jgi:hypothetical protein
MRSQLLLVLSLVVFAGCSSSPHKAEEIETKVENKGEVKDEVVGINKDGNMVVQRKVKMSEELRRIQYEVYELEDRVYGNRKFGSKGLYGVLKDCRTEVASKKNGGDGKLRFIEPLERVTDKEEEYKIGLDEDKQLVGVSEEFLKDRITRFQGYKQVLVKRQDEYEEKVDICKAELKARQHDIKSPTTENKEDM